MGAGPPGPSLSTKNEAVCHPFGRPPSVGGRQQSRDSVCFSFRWQRAGQHSGDPGTDSPSQVRRRGGRLARRGAGHGQSNGARRGPDRTLRLRSVAVVRTGPRSDRRLAASVASDRVDAVRGADGTATLAPARDVGRRRPPDVGLEKLGAARCWNEEMVERVRASAKRRCYSCGGRKRVRRRTRPLLLIAGRRGRYGRAGVHRRDRRGNLEVQMAVLSEQADGARGFPSGCCGTTPRPCGTANTTTPT